MGDRGLDTVSQLASVTSGELLDEPSTSPNDAGSKATEREAHTLEQSPSQQPHPPRQPLDNNQITVAAGVNGRGSGTGTASMARGAAAASGVAGAGTAARGPGKFRALIDAYACISDQQFVVIISCIYSSINDDQPSEEAALDEALEDVDEAVRPQVIDLLRNLLQKVSIRAFPSLLHLFM